MENHILVIDRRCVDGIDLDEHNLPVPKKEIWQKIDLNDIDAAEFIREWKYDANYPIIEFKQSKFEYNNNNIVARTADLSHKSVIGYWKKII